MFIRCIGRGVTAVLWWGTSVARKSPIGKAGVLLLTVYAALSLTVGTLFAASPVGYEEYGHFRGLLAALQERPELAEFVPYTEFAPDQDKLDHGTCLDYLESRPELIAKIRKDLGCDEVNWRLEDMSYRLLYVPESRLELAAQFVSYSRDVIAELLVRTGLPNPYSAISTELAVAPPSTAIGEIRAVIVRDLAREYQARYQFSGATERRINLDLSGRTGIGEVGSYSSYLQHVKDGGGWRFLRDRRTIWKSWSENPYTVLMTPLEETLHICLRTATERAILQAITTDGAPSGLQDVRDVVYTWLAVEEAVVGAVVYHLVPLIVVPRVPDLSPEMIKQDLDTKAGFDKYRLLPRAIDMVKEQGVRTVIDDYLRDASKVRRMLGEPG